MAKQFKPETLCVQAGWTPKKGEPRVLPIYQSTTFKYDTSEQMARLFDLEDSGYFYTRLQNPTNDAVAAKIAALEGGVAAMLTSSGQAANFYAIFNICQAGDHFVCSSTIYGGTFNLFGVTMKKLGVDVTFVNPDAPEEEISAAFRPNTKALFGETISNPTLEVLDIEKFARIAHKHGVPLIVDNTFPTPINCRPFEWEWRRCCPQSKAHRACVRYVRTFRCPAHRCSDWRWFRRITIWYSGGKLGLFPLRMHWRQ